MAPLEIVEETKEEYDQNREQLRSSARWLAILGFLIIVVSFLNLARATFDMFRGRPTDPNLIDKEIKLDSFRRINLA